jgi:glycine oxidase
VIKSVFLVFMLIERLVDYIIIGQGLAGSSLALRLIESGKSVVVFDEPSKNQCSKVAAGLFNPITGIGIVKTWLAEELFASLHDFYIHSEKLLERRFFFPQLLYRPFYSAEEQNNWMAKSNESSVGLFIDKIFTASAFADQVKDPFGGILLKSCGYLDTASFLEATRNFLVSCHSWCEAHFNFQDLTHTADGVTYQNLKAKKIVFCNGVSANPFFDWLNIRPLKGETVTLKLGFEPTVIFNRGVYLVPFAGTAFYKAGATYELKDVSKGVTQKGRAELTDKLNGLLQDTFEIVGQEWGIRPTTIDRRPMLGCHPNYKNFIIFNGLGTKGVSLAPYFSGQLANWLNGSGEIEREVNIKRFNALYSKS